MVTIVEGHQIPKSIGFKVYQDLISSMGCKFWHDSRAGMDDSDTIVKLFLDCHLHTSLWCRRYGTLIRPRGIFKRIVFVYLSLCTLLG